MRSLDIPSITISILSILSLLSQLQPAQASPFPLELGGVDILRRACPNPCGYYGQVCCESNQECYTTNNNEAACRSPGSGNAGWQYFTTTYTQTDLMTITSTWSSQLSGPTGDGGCDSSIGETPCGGTCCNAGQMCGKQGICEQAGSSTFPTAAPTPPVRPTSNTEVTVTATATVPFLPPVGTDGSTAVGVEASTDDDGLSGGAIAGIVIGVIAGLIILFLLCACFCFKGALDGIWAIFGLGRRRRRSETYEEEHHHHHSHGGGFLGRKWFGARDDRSRSDDHTSVSSKKKSWWSWTWVGIAIGALLLCLGLKRRRDNRDDEKSSYYYSDASSGYYPYYSSEYTSSSK